MHQHAIDERHELSSTLRAAGPDAPTLCGDWTTAVLAAHLALRERSVAEMAGRLPVAVLRRNAERELRDFAAREPYERVVDAIDQGPSWSDSIGWAPVAALWSLPPVREAVNLLEYVIHHEDVRRAADGVAPRAMPVARQRAVWSRLRLGAPLTMRRVPVGVRLVWPGHGEVLTRRARHGHPLVTVEGDPVELALVAFGRQRVAQVAYDGSPADVAIVRGATIAV
jgi:uncharacterized protein (TIGR03085 family)